MVELEGNILTALCLVMVIVVAAMGIRSGLIVGFGIPASFLFSLIFIYLLGYSFNFMVMFGMLLGLGMLIDGAIVVTEYADRKMTEGFGSRDAYLAAAKRIYRGVHGFTLAAFLPTFRSEDQQNYAACDCVHRFERIALKHWSSPSHRAIFNGRQWTASSEDPDVLRGGLYAPGRHHGLYARRWASQHAMAYSPWSQLLQS